MFIKPMVPTSLSLLQEHKPRRLGDAGKKMLRLAAAS
jgi:hypothetical protein